MTTKQPHLWYIRRDGEVSGPFPTGQVVQYLILGRLEDTDEASIDQSEWQAIADLAEFDRSVETATDADNARRWADERRSERRIDKIDERADADRRRGEGLTEQVSRAAREMLIETFWKIPPKGAKATLVVLGTFTVVIGILILLTPKQDVIVEKCSASPTQGVDWSHCDLAETRINQANLTSSNLMGAHLHGANISNSSFMHGNLQYVDLGHAKVINVSFSEATLKGSNLRQSTLDGINFIGTDLSYADFRGAKLIDVNFSQARLDFAIWTDGRVCKEGSIDVCK